MTRRGTKKNNVTLREKVLNDGNISLYLDIYRDGIRTYEFLKLYIKDKPKTSLERINNRETLALAEEYRTKKETDLNHDAFGLISPNKKKVNLHDYFEDYIQGYTKKDIKMIKLAYRHFILFLERDYTTYCGLLKPENLTKGLIVEFKEYLEGKLKGEGANSAFQRFKKVIKAAYNDGVFLKNPCEGISCKIDRNTLQKDILTIDEIKLLASTPAPNNEVKRAFLFSCFAGLRFCDIAELRHGNFDPSSNILKFTQVKTKGHSSASQVIIPLNETLLHLKGESGKQNEPVFNLPSHSSCLKTLEAWTRKAGIDKHITWHCARHSFAVNLLGEYKTDIKTVASLLGHSGLKHTEKYTRAVDELKQKAISSLPTIKLEN